MCYVAFQLTSLVRLAQTVDQSRNVLLWRSNGIGY